MKKLNLSLFFVALIAWGFNGSLATAQAQEPKKNEKPCAETPKPRRKAPAPFKNMSAPPTNSTPAPPQFSLEQMKQLAEALRQPVQPITVTVNTPPAPAPVIIPAPPPTNVDLSEVNAKLDNIGTGVGANSAKLDHVIELEKSNGNWVKVGTVFSAAAAVFSGVSAFKHNPPDQVTTNISQAVTADPTLSAAGGNSTGSTATAAGGTATAAGGAGGAGGSSSSTSTATGGAGGTGNGGNGTGGSVNGSGNASAGASAGSSSTATAGSTATASTTPPSNGGGGNGNSNGTKPPCPAPQPPTCPNPPKGGQGKH